MARNTLNWNPVNPVALREMRARMRGPRTFILLGFYLGFLAFLLYVVYLRSGGGTTYTYGGYTGNASFGPTKSFEIGQNLFLTVFLFLVAFVSLVTPATMGGVVSRELEGKTYELLVVTPLRSRAVAFGKLLAGLSFIFFMVLSAVPIACIVFIFGGVSLENILVGFGVVLMAAITYGAIGLFFSALLKRTGMAIMCTYGIVALLTIGSLLLSNGLTSAITTDQNRLPASARIDPRVDPSYDFAKRLLAFNPLAAVGSILATNAPYHPSGAEELQLFPNSRLFGGAPTAYYTNTAGSSPANQAARKPIFSGVWPLYTGYFLVYTAFSLLFYLLSLLLMKPGLTYRLPLFRRRDQTKGQAKPKPKSSLPRLRRRPVQTSVKIEPIAPRDLPAISPEIEPSVEAGPVAQG